MLLADADVNCGGSWGTGSVASRKMLGAVLYQHASVAYWFGPYTVLLSGMLAHGMGNAAAGDRAVGVLVPLLPVV